MNNFWKDKRIFITGATGFIGSWLTKHLVDFGAFVVVLVRDQSPQSELIKSGYLQKVQVVSGKLEDFHTLERVISEYQVDTIFHLGAQTQVTNAVLSPYYTFETNIRGTYNLLEACRRTKGFVKRIIVASSDKAYGQGERLPLVENTPLGAIYPYDVSKACTDMIALSYYHTYDLPVVVTRAGNVYGGGDFNWDRLIPGIINSLYKDERPVLRSDGSYLRDYLFIEDMVYAYLMIGKYFEERDLSGEVFNFGTTQPSSVLDVYRLIARFMGKEEISPIIEARVTSETKDQYVSIEKATQMLNWKPSCSLQVGLEITVDWYKHFFMKRNLESLRTSKTPQFVTQLSS